MTPRNSNSGQTTTINGTGGHMTLPEDGVVGMKYSKESSSGGCGVVSRNNSSTTILQQQTPRKLSAAQRNGAVLVSAASSCGFQSSEQLLSCRGCGSLLQQQISSKDNSPLLPGSLCDSPKELLSFVSKDAGLAGCYYCSASSNANGTPPVTVKTLIMSATPSQRINESSATSLAVAASHQQHRRRNSPPVTDDSSVFESADAAGVVLRIRKHSPLLQSQKSLSTTDLHQIQLPKTSCATWGKDSTQTVNHSNGLSAGQQTNNNSSSNTEGSCAVDKNVQSGTKRRSQSERRFHGLFHSVAGTEHLLSRFTCAYVSEMGLLIQGHLYVSHNWICFHSNIFGIAKLMEIPVRSIVAVSKEKTAKIIPNAVGIRTKGGKMFLFGSLLSRDNTYQLLMSVVHRKQAKEPPAEIHMPLIHESESKIEQVKEDSSSMLSTEEDMSDDVSCSSRCNSPVIPHSSTRHRQRKQRASCELYTFASELPHRTSKYMMNTANPGTHFSHNSCIRWLQTVPGIMFGVTLAVLIVGFLFVSPALMTMKLLHTEKDTVNNLWQCVECMDTELPKESSDRAEILIDSVLEFLHKARKGIEDLRLELLAARKSTTTGSELSGQRNI